MVLNECSTAGTVGREGAGTGERETSDSSPLHFAPLSTRLISLNRLKRELKNGVFFFTLLLPQFDLSFPSLSLLSKSKMATAGKF